MKSHQLHLSVHRSVSEGWIANLSHGYRSASALIPTLLASLVVTPGSPDRDLCLKVMSDALSNGQKLWGARPRMAVVPISQSVYDDMRELLLKYSAYPNSWIAISISADSQGNLEYRACAVPIGSPMTMDPVPSPRLAARSTSNSKDLLDLVTF